MSQSTPFRPLATLRASERIAKTIAETILAGTFDRFEQMIAEARG